MIFLKQLRLSKNMTQEALAKELGVSRTTVAMWETTGQYPPAQMLITIADFFEVSIDSMVGRECEFSRFAKS